MDLLSTEQLVQVILDNEDKHFEAELVLDGGIATHFIFAKDGVLVDEGIDSVEQEISPELFVDLYKGKLWHIFQVVEANLMLN